MVEIEVYCDESYPDVLGSKSLNKVKYLMIGSLWIDKQIREKLKEDIKSLKNKHNAFGELKWRKVSPSKLDFYKELIDLFILYEHYARFSCIAVEKSKIDLSYHNNSNELAFYKFYYQLLQQWINRKFTYTIFCDRKNNKNRNQYKTFKACLEHPASNPIDIKNLCALNSKESALLQFSDFLLGIASVKMNSTISLESAKMELIEYFENKLGRKIKVTGPAENKFNIFKIKLKEGGK